MGAALTAAPPSPAARGYFCGVGTFRWTPDRMEQLEHAVTRHKRVTLRRRGNEYVVVATGMTQSRGRDALIGYLAMTGDEMTFVLADLDFFQVLEF
jgi:hypothetical protein